MKERDRKNAVLTIRLTDLARGLVERLAADEDRSVASWIELMIRREGALKYEDWNSPRGPSKAKRVQLPSGNVPGQTVARAVDVLERLKAREHDGADAGKLTQGRDPNELTREPDPDWLSSTLAAKQPAKRK